MDAADQVRNSARYESAVRRWFAMVRREPHTMIVGSVMFLLTAWPIVTIGPARLALARYMAYHERGERTTYMQSLREAFSRRGVASWFMGLSDILALLMAGGCFLAVSDDGYSTAVRALYAFLFVLDAVYLASGLYRFAALSDEPDGRFLPIAARGFLMAVGCPGWTALFWCVQLVALVVCAATGVGLVLIFPASSAMLGVCAYGEMKEVMIREVPEDSQG